MSAFQALPSLPVAAWPGASLYAKMRIVDDQFDFSNKIVIVTGGARGIGQSITVRFLEHGAQVLICARRPPDAPIAVRGRQAEFVAAELREHDQMQKVVSYAVQKWGRIDVLVNNAGGAPPADAATASPRFSQAVIQINLLVPLHLSQAVNAVMQKQPTGGVIVNIASVSGVRPSPGTAAYGAAKAGLLSLTESLAVEWAPKVRVNAIVAGPIRTELAHLHYGDEAAVARVGATIPLGRMGEPTDVADACLYFASPLSHFVTGARLLVHGGGERPAFLSAAAPRE